MTSHVRSQHWGHGDKSKTSQAASAFASRCECLAKDANFNIGQMASLCVISDRQLQRLFKKYLGCSPGSWLRHLKCRLAKELIAQGYSTKAAAAQLHFSTDAHFCREFKKVFGAPPQSFAPNRLNQLRLPKLDEQAVKDREAGI